MKISVILVSVLLFAAIFLPLAYLVTISARTETKIKKSLKKFGEENKLSLETVTLHGNLILALDRIHKKLVFTTRKTILSNVQIIDLPMLSECQIRTLRNKGKNLEWVSLELTDQHSKQNIVFYEEQQDSGPVVDPMASLNEAEKWKNIIQPLLKTA
jgi:hypothetical protein